MKPSPAPLTLLALLVLAPLRSPAAPPPDEGVALTSTLAEVTVYADRARVVRKAAADLAPGVSKVAFAKLPGWIDEGSVRLSVAPADAAELVDVEIRRTYLARPDDEELRKAEAAVQEMADQAAALQDEKNVLDAQTRQLDSIRAFSLDKMPKDAAVREVKVEEYAGLLAFMGDTMARLAAAKRELARKERDLQPELNARSRKLNELRQRAQLEQRTVVATLKAGAARRAELRLTYMIPGATWEPVHELRTGGDAATVTLVSFGTVTQTTGEDWDGVALTLSTQRSTDTIRIPELEKLLVGPRLMPHRDDSFSVASGKFSGQIAVWNTYNNGLEQQQEFALNLDKQQLAQGRNVKTFERLQQKRGTTAHFAAVGPQTIRTDGRPVRVLVGSEQMTAQPKIVAMPAVSLNAVRTAQVLNGGKQPLLPGPVMLYIDGAFLGATETDFVAPGESFPLFIGMADPIKLTRELDRRRSALTWTGKRTRMQVAFGLSAENLGDKPATLELSDRIPVSETEEMRVLGLDIQPEVKPDSKGVLRWTVTLAPKEKKEFRIAYTLEYPRDLPQRLRAAPNAQMMDGAASDLSEQISELEVMLE